MSDHRYWEINRHYFALCICFDELTAIDFRFFVRQSYLQKKDASLYLSLSPVCKFLMQIIGSVKLFLFTKFCLSCS